MKSCPSCHRPFVVTEDRCPLDGAALVDGAGDAPAMLGRQLGTYELVALLGTGGMGSIYIARHLTLRRYVAIKTLRPELASRTDNVARFFQEAHTINALRHPNIVESIDLVEDPVDGAYCVLELLKGPDLKRRLERGPVTLDSAVHIATQLADALAKVHAIGVVHRDLKPENLILIERDGRDDVVKLIDFGIAQIGDQAAGVAGTAAYMAPEQGERGAAVDQRADIYSLGVILFEMVTGRHPFPSPTDAAYLVAHADARVPRPSSLNWRCPHALDLVILRCMEKQPDARFASADAVANALRAVDLGDPNRRNARFVAAGIALAATAAIAAFLVVPTYLARSEATAAPVVTAKADAVPSSITAMPLPVPPLPATVEIRVASTPEGAIVYRAGETVALGTTPFTVTLPRGPTPIEVRVEKPGYRDETAFVSVDTAREISVALTADASGTPRVRKSPAVTRERPKRGGKAVPREGVMDPFAAP